MSEQLWENEAVVEELKKQLSIKRCRFQVLRHPVVTVTLVNTFRWVFSASFRIGQVEEIGGVVAFLCSEEASYITGETITASGGMGSRL